MDDVGLQRAIFASLERGGVSGGGGGFRAAAIRPTVPRSRDIAPTQPRSSSGMQQGAGVLNNRRNHLEREGILPRGGGVVGGYFAHRQPPSGGGDQEDQSNGDQRPMTTARGGGGGGGAGGSTASPDYMIGWKDLSTGGRTQTQNPQQSHILLITEEALTARTTQFWGCDTLLMAREDPVDFRAATDKLSMRTMLKSLTGSGKYSTFVIAFTTSPPETCKSFVGISIHYEFTGAVFVSVDEWKITKDGSMPGNVARMIDRVQSIERPQMVKPKRDGLDIRLPFTSKAIDVYINDHLHFKGIESKEMDIGGDQQLYVMLMAAGGRFSAKHFEISDGLGTAPSNGTPPPPTRSGAAATRARSRGRVAPVNGGPVNRRDASPMARNPPPSNNNPPRRQPSTRSQPSQQHGGGNARPSNNNNAAASDEGGPFDDMINSEIIDRSPGVQWEDVAGVPDAKTLLNEAVVLPLLVPELFTGARTPWKGVLLYGPPGTGKTMLAKAVATCAKTTFYSISASTLVSRYHGESEKICKALFQHARRNAPSTIFFDEIDALMSKRGSGGEHEASRRLKAEMLQQIDGMGGGGEEGGPQVMVLATTNTPWDLDEAMRRRLEKRIYIPLPNEDGRRDFLKTQFSKTLVDPNIDVSKLAKITAGYSGADLSQVCRDAAMMPMRRLIADKSPTQLAEMKARGEMKIAAVTMADFEMSISKVQPSVSKAETVQFEQWSKDFGST